MKTNIHIKNLMKRDFLILDGKIALKNVIKKINKEDAVMIINNGKFIGIVSHENLLRGLLNKNPPLLKDLTFEKTEILDAKDDITKAIDVVKHKAEFIIVKDNENIQGLITKNELIDAESKIINNLISKTEKKNFKVNKSL